jgi:hypothetical protein
MLWKSLLDVIIKWELEIKDVIHLMIYIES